MLILHYSFHLSQNDENANGREKKIIINAILPFKRNKFLCAAASEWIEYEI